MIDPLPSSSSLRNPCGDHQHGNRNNKEFRNNDESDDLKKRKSLLDESKRSSSFRTPLLDTTTTARTFVSGTATRTYSSNSTVPTDITTDHKTTVLFHKDKNDNKMTPIKNDAIKAQTDDVELLLKHQKQSTTGCNDIPPCPTKKEEYLEEQPFIGMPAFSVQVPHDGLYGLIFGRKKHKSHFESVDYSNSNDQEYGNYNMEDNDENDACKKKTAVTLPMNMSMSGQQHIRKKINRHDIDGIPFHCGCRYRAIFTVLTDGVDHDKSHTNLNQVVSLTNPISWQGTGEKLQSSSSPGPESVPVPAPAPKCTQVISSMELPFRSSNQHQHRNKKRPHPYHHGRDSTYTKLVTSSRVGKIIYLPKGTHVRVECVYSCCCGKDHHGRNPQGVACMGCCHWVWGLALQRKILLEGEKHVTYLDPMQEKHAVLLPRGPCNKPYICTQCLRTFANCQGVRNHCVSAHVGHHAGKDENGNDVNDCSHNDGDKQDDEWSDLVGPKIFRVPLKAVYQDEDMVVVVKPQGIACQGDTFTLPKSDLLMPFRSTLGRAEDLSKPRITHRLDAATGGLLVVAKTSIAETKIKKSFEERSCKKRYRAIVFGKMEQSCEYSKNDAKSIKAQMNMFFARDGTDISENNKYEDMGVISKPLSGKEAITCYEIVSYTPCDHPLAKGFITTVDLYPLTGRLHQLRKHLSLVGHPIWGDVRYAPYSMHEKSTIKNLSKENDDDLLGVNDEGLGLHSKMCLWSLEIMLPHPCKENTMVHAKIDEPLWYERLRENVELKR